ncbi:MAG: hypothetical protein EPO32_07340 [Anaerolineae bacterium]|nr:MAG: hypothetical protein EPO32_07340 [Anaerolineae bacterium]
MLRRRVGVFLTFIALAVLGLFFSSDYAGEPNFWLLLSGVVLMGLGTGLLRATRPAPPPSQRFRLMRRMLGGKPAGPPPAADDDDDDKPAPAAAGGKPKRGLFGRKK